MLYYIVLLQVFVPKWKERRKTNWFFIAKIKQEPPDRPDSSWWEEAMNLTDQRPTELERKDPGILDEHTKIYYYKVVQLLSCVRLFINAWSTARQPPLSFTISGVCSNSCPLSRWFHPTISSSVAPFSPAVNPSQHQGLSQWVGSWHQVAKVLELQLKSALTHSLLFRESPIVVPGNEWMKENEWILKETHDCLTPE